MNKCAVPECEAKLYAGNKMGVCRRHNHAPGYCSCVQCKGFPVAVARLSVQTVEVPYATSNSGVEGRAKISLPRAPWESAP